MSCSFTEIDLILSSVVLMKEVAHESKTVEADLIKPSLVQTTALVKDDVVYVNDTAVCFSSFSSSKRGFILRMK